MNPNMVNKRPKIKKNQTTHETNCISEPTGSGALVGSNDDLLTEILLRLPVASVLRFKSVSKHWKSLLSHQHFTLLFDNVPVSPGFFVRDLYVPFDVENKTPPPFRSLNFYPDRCGIKIVQSCNGLLLCCSHRGKEHTRKYYVFNPTTKQYAVIPSVIGGPDASKTIRFMGLAFRRTGCVHYKVVCFRNEKHNKKRFQIQIYSSETEKWRISQESFSVSDSLSFGPGVYSKGTMHWIPNFFDLVCFKIDVEQVQKMLLPERASSSWGSRPLYFGESRGHLHLVEAARHENPLQVNVYELMSDYSGWFIKYRVELDDLPTAYPDMVYSNRDPSNYLFEVFDVLRGDEEEESTFVVVRIPEKIMRYDVVNKSFEKMIDLPGLLCYRRICYTNVHRYSQILSSFRG
ncbi:hypothetical protein E3N88_21796 [Mikania micrantha]|uniref:Uncharacterized protein n=1 Tax=Mikania micrantha TaxID=192012 RepID=A0A5N6NB59_9ASTR|nr:hypothetical protein E3N88_21796 [Mikania micrantha]